MSQNLKKTGLFSILVLGSGNVLGTVISAVALILFSRYMGPTEFGLFSAAFAAMQITIRLSDLGTNMAVERSIARVHDQKNNLADRYMRVAFWFKIFMFTFAMVVAWFIAPWITQSFLHIDDLGLIRLAFILSFSTIFFEYSTAVFQSTHRFAQVARITIAQATGKLLFGLIFIWQGMLHSTTALLVYGLMPGIGALLGWKGKILSTFSLPSTWKKDLQLILSVAKWTSIAAISATIADNIDTLLVQSYMSSFDTGIWSGASRIATFAGVIGWTIGSVLSVRVARYKDPKHLNEYLSKAWKLSLLVLFVLLLSIPFASLAIRLTIGSAYMDSTVPLQILLLATGISGATAPYIALFYLFDKPQYYAIAGIIQTVLLIGGDILFIPTHGLIGAAYVRVLVRVVVIIFTLWYVQRSYRQFLSQKNL